MHHFAVHRKRFHLAMGKMQNRAAGRLVNTAAFHSDKAVLHNVHATDAVFAAKFV